MNSLVVSLICCSRININREDDHTICTDQPCVNLKICDERHLYMVWLKTLGEIVHNRDKPAMRVVYQGASVHQHLLVSSEVARRYEPGNQDKGDVLHVSFYYINSNLNTYDISSLQVYSNNPIDLYKDVRILSCTQHKNVVWLAGFCIEGNQRLLVFEYVCNGPLDIQLQVNKGTHLDWSSHLIIVFETTGLCVSDPFLLTQEKKDVSNPATFTQGHFGLFLISFVCLFQQASTAISRFSAKDYSDHMALVHAYEGWKEAEKEGSAYEYCWRNFLSAETLQAIHSALLVYFAVAVVSLMKIGPSKSSLEAQLLEKSLVRGRGIDNILGFDWPASPSTKSMVRSLEVLYSLGVVDDDAKLTSPVGFQVAELPLDPMVSKMIIVSDKIECLEEIITIATILSVQSIWISVKGQRELDEAKLRFAVSERAAKKSSIETRVSLKIMTKRYSESISEATSGAIGAVLSTTILYPLDTCKAKYQAEVRSHVRQKYKYFSFLNFPKFICFE
ncbi:unnamed protein product [Lactuca saligna]|uniref:RNA helicase n=1 Tax=Lactuca saligna TaxID=75948 RepID=A0AA36EDX5_LACSI|nr:unnamed protein product [Lactuca saligna]